MPIPKIQVSEMSPDSTLAIRFPVPTIIWCETNRNQSVALQTQKIQRRGRWYGSAVSRVELAG